MLECAELKKNVCFTRCIFLLRVEHPVANKRADVEDSYYASTRLVMTRLL
jgi:hypothetical protein